MKYTDYYNHLVTEAFGDVERVKWKQQVPTLTDTIIDDYLEKFQDIRIAKYRSAQNDIENFNILKGNDRFDISKYKQWSDFETFIDYVSGQVDLEKSKGQKLKDVQVKDYKSLVDENGLQIYYADTPRACIAYKGNIPYSWCVSRSTTNLYYAYRYRSNQPSFYFVKDVAATKEELEKPFTGQFENPWHFFVIQKTKHQTYIVSNANNNGDMEMTWNQILEIQPKLNGMEHYFKHVPLKRKEVLKYKQLKDLGDRDFAKLKYVDKSLYLDMFPGVITNVKFKYLPDELKNKYIGFGTGLSEDQYNQIKNNKNLLKRFVQMVERSIEVYFGNDRLRNLSDGDWCVLFDTVDGQKILEKYIVKDTDSHRSLLEIVLHRSTKLNRNTDKIIENILSIKPYFTAADIKQLMHYSSNPVNVVEFIAHTKKGNFEWATEMNDVMYRLLLTNSKNFSELLDVLLKLNKKEKTSKDASSNYNLHEESIATILKESPNFKQALDIFKQNGYSIDISEYQVDRLIYGRHETVYADMSALIQYLGDKFTNRSIYHLVGYINGKFGTSEQKQDLIELIISVKSKLDDSAFRSLIHLSPSKEKTLLLIKSNNKYDGDAIEELLFLISSRISELNENDKYTIVALICKYGKDTITESQKLMLITSLSDVDKVIKEMQKYNITLPVLNNLSIQLMLSDSVSPLNFAYYLQRNNITFNVKKSEIQHLVIYSKNPLELLSVFQLFSIPIVLSDTAIFNFLFKNRYKLTYVRSLIAKLVEIYGKQRLLNLRRLTFQLKNIIDDTNTDKSV